MRNQQGERSRESVSKEVPAMHGMMGCARYSNVSERSMCVQYVLDITGGPCAVQDLALPRMITADSRTVANNCTHDFILC